MSFRHYAVRRLNPFAGVAQVVASEEARAISLDGSKWEVQVIAEVPNDCWGSLSDKHRETRFFRFGIWSQSSGLRKVPINPIMDIGAMLEASAPITGELRGIEKKVPFPLADALELWLLDHRQNPLALLASAVPGENLAPLRQRRWCAAPLNDRNLGGERGDGESPIADNLEALIRRQGQGTVQWFRRTAPGSGPGIRLDDSGDTRFAADLFPQLPVRSLWKDTDEQALIDTWIRRLSPQILCLPYLDPVTRTTIESMAHDFALEVASVWRMYPPSVDMEFINSARIEARLRTSAAGG